MFSVILRKINSAAYFAKQYCLRVNQQIIDVIFQISIFIKHKTYYSRYPVLIGTVFYNKGGVYNHIRSLHYYLKTKNSTLPPLDIRSQVMQGNHQLVYHRLIEKFQLDKHPIVHSHADTWFINRCYQLQQKGSKWVHTYHSFFFEEAYDPMENWMTEMNETLINVASKADVKIAVSKWFQSYLKEQFNIDTIYIPNCADIEKCENADKRRFIEKYHLTDFILFASSMLYVKNPVEFIQLAVRLPHLKFVMLGSDINIYNMSALYKKNLPSNLQIMEDTFDHQDFLDVISACNVFVMTSRLESLPTALMEAMALGKCVVASNVKGCIEIIEDNKYGYLYQLGNIDDLAEKTLKAYNDKIIGSKARQRVYDHYNWKTVAPQVDKIYQNLLRN